MIFAVTRRSARVVSRVATVAIPLIAVALDLPAQLAPLPPRDAIRSCAVLTGGVHGDALSLRVAIPRGCDSITLAVTGPAIHPADSARVSWNPGVRVVPIAVINKTGHRIRADVQMRADSVLVWRRGTRAPRSILLPFIDVADLQQPWCFAAARRQCSGDETVDVPAVEPGAMSPRTRMLLELNEMRDSFRIVLQIAGRSAATDIGNPREMATRSIDLSPAPVTTSSHAPAPYHRGVIAVRFYSPPTRGQLQRVADVSRGKLLGARPVAGSSGARDYIFSVPTETTSDGAMALLDRVRRTDADGVGLVYANPLAPPLPPLRISHDTVSKRGDQVEATVVFHNFPSDADRAFMRTHILGRLGIPMGPITRESSVPGAFDAIMSLSIPPHVGAGLTGERLQEWLLTMPNVELVSLATSFPCPDSPAKRCFPNTIGVDSL